MAKGRLRKLMGTKVTRRNAWAVIAACAGATIAATVLVQLGIDALLGR